MWNSNVFGLFLLGCCGVLLFCSKPVTAEETTVNYDAVTLSTELQPPPVPVAGEPRGIVYLINLFAVKNKTAEDSEEKGENSLTNSDDPEIIGPLASILLIVDEEGDEEIVYDDYPEGQVIDYVLQPPKESEDESRIPSENEEPKESEEKIKKPKKIRRKRTLFKKHGGKFNNYPTGGGGGGGYPQNGYNQNGGGSGQSVIGIPIFLVPVSNGGGGGQSRGHGREQQRGHGGQGCNSCNGGGGGGYNNHPSGGYPSGGGGDYHPVGGGGGGSNSQSWAQASAGSSSYGNGR